MSAAFVFNKRWSGSFIGVAGLCLLAALCVSPCRAQGLFDGNQNLPPFGSFTGSDFDVVSLQNGNLHIHIPLQAWKQRGGTTLHLAFVYDTPSWTRASSTAMVNNQRIETTTLTTDSQRKGIVADWGTWEVSSPIDGTTCTGGNSYHNWVVTDPEGTKHPLDLITGNLTGCGGAVTQSPTTDGSGMMVNLGSTPATLTLKDGSQITLSKSADYLYVGSTLEDANGNQIGATDTLGRTLFTVTQGTGFTTYTVKDSNGNPQTYRLDFNAPSGGLNTNFCGGLNNPPLFVCHEVVTSSANTALGRLTLPNGTFYQFTWANADDGELQSVTLPTGATISYTYGSSCTHGAVVNGETTITVPWTCRATMSSRTVTADGQANTWTYNQGTVTDPLGNDEVHVFSPVTVGSLTTVGTYETSVTNYQGSAASGTLLKKVVADYTGEPDLAFVSNTPKNVRPVRKTTTVDHNLVSKTETDFETFNITSGTTTITATRLNPTEVREFGYGSGLPGAQVRRTDYTYLHNQNSTYATLNIVDRQASVIVYSGTSSTPSSQTTFEYDVYSHAGLPAMGASGAVQHDNATRSTAYTTRGNRTGVGGWVNTTGASLTTNYQYDDAGNVVATKDPKGNVTLFDYTDVWSSGGGNACAPVGQAKAYVTKTTNPLNQTTTAAYLSCSGLVGATTDANGNTTGRAYDEMNRVVQVAYPVGYITNCYSDDGGATCAKSGPPYKSVMTKSASPSPDQVKTTVFDSLGRVVQTQTSASTTSNADTVYIDTVYNRLGQVHSVSNPRRSTSNPSTDGVTTYVYDALGRTCVLIPPDGTVVTGTNCLTTRPTNDVTTVFAGNTTTLGYTTTVTDETGKTRMTQTDALGRVTSVWEDPSGQNIRTSYTYDALDNLVSVVQNGSHTRSFTYDSLSRLLCASNPETSSAQCPAQATSAYTAGTVGYTYDTNGNVLTKQDPRGVNGAITYVYDSLNRLTQKTYTDGGITPNVTYSYDSNPPDGLFSPANLIGRMAKGSTGGSRPTETFFSYDNNGREIVHAQCVVINSCGANPPSIWAINSFFDAAGNRIGNTDSNSVIFTQTNNAAGWPTQLTSTFVDLTHPSTLVTTDSSNGFFANGAIRKAIFGNGLTELSAYNNRFQPCILNLNSVGTSLLSTCSDSVPTGTLQDFRYTYNAGASNNGDVATWNGTGQQRFSRAYSYDSVNRLSVYSDSATSQSCKGLSWTYDIYGNRTAQSTTAGTCNSFTAAVTSKNQLFDPINNIYQYDAAGNMTFDGSHHYLYDAEGRLVSVDSGAGAFFVYDATGHRVAKGNGSSITKLYLYDSNGRVVTERDGSGNWLQTNAYLGSQLVAVYRQTDTGFIFKDHLGSTRLITLSDQCVHDSMDFLPFGEQILGASDISYKFTGQERDNPAEGGLDNFEARYISNGIGRFMSPDPSSMSGDLVDSENPQAWNMYSYVLNNPVNGADPDGLDYYLIGGDRCGHDEIKCDEQGYLLDSQENRVVVTDQQISGSNGLASIDDKGNLQIKTAQGTFQGDFFDPNIGSNGAAIVPQAIVTPSFEDQKFDALETAGAMADPGVTAAVTITAPQYAFMGITTAALSGAGSTLTLEAGEIAATPGELAELSQASTQGGKAAVRKALRSYIKRLAKHEADLARYKEAGGYTSHTEGEIKHFQTMIRLAEDYLIKNP